MTQWTDELAAGCEKLIYFGGEGDAIGNGDYLRSDLTPLPVAATLGVFAAKTFDAAPVGVFSSAGDARTVPSLQSRWASAPAWRKPAPREKARRRLNVGAPTVRITDCQGNETELATQRRRCACRTRICPYFVEGAIWRC